ncbi:MAG TPA: hypothetical protein VJC09_03115 [Candidatus Saccharimonadales bacterium]|nr:hypothetical protein [Candidatus Saccharimonadales bacterium]
MAIDDMFWDVEHDRVIKIKSFKFPSEKNALPLIRVDFLDERSQTGVVNGSGRTIPEDTAVELAEAYSLRHENETFYNLMVNTIDL